MGRLRIVDSLQIKELTTHLALKANFSLPQDVRKSLENSLKKETNKTAKKVLRSLLENIQIAKKKHLPICQDTGIVVVFLKIGQDVRIKGGFIIDAINSGIKEAYCEGYLRKSVVNDPLLRINTGTNIPAIIHTEYTKGNKIHITVLPKGCGSENMSRLKMLSPSEGIAGIKSFVIETIKSAGPNPCPPVIVGIGMGGNFETAPLLAKKALLRKIGTRNKHPHLACIEEKLLKEINHLNIGPAGLGGKITALDVHIESAPCHIASLPVAVNIQCHAARWATGII